MSSRTAAARKRLQDPHPKVPPSERLVNQAKSFAPSTRARAVSIPSLRIAANPMHAISVTRLDLADEFRQPPPSPERSRAYNFLHPQSFAKVKTTRSSQAIETALTYSPSLSRHPPLRIDPRGIDSSGATLPEHSHKDVGYHTPPLPPPTNPVLHSPQRALPAKVLLSYEEQLHDFPFLSSCPPSPGGYSSKSPSDHSAPSKLPSPSSIPSRRSVRDSSASTDLPEYRSTCSSYQDSHFGGPSSQDNAMNLDPSLVDNQHRHHLAYQYPYSSRPGLPPEPVPALPPIQDRGRFLYRSFLGAPNSLPPSPVHTLRELPGDSASLSSLSGYSGTSASTGAWPPPPPPPPSPNFYYPGSRSVARPKVSINSLHKPRSKSRLRLGKASQGNLRRLDIPSPNAQVFETPPESPEFVRVAVQPISPGASPEASTSVLGDGSSSIYNPHKAPTNAFVFPTSRSRARPKLSSRPPKPPKSSNSSSNSSNSRDVNQPEERSRFMVKIFKKKKAKTANLTPGLNVIVSDSDVSPTDNIGPPEGQSDPKHGFTGRQERTRRMKSKRGSYPLDPYDSILLDNDRHTGELLSRLNPTGSPSFHDYGNTPPSSVLDLGCGQGYWVLEAAIAWKEYGTKVTGYDIIDISRNLLPWATEQGVLDNIRFVRGNFLKQQLPFGNNTFDLVRMSCLGMCITSDSWGFVLQEVCRVLSTGGRLELIDDQIFFPYGKVSSLMNDTSSVVESAPPRLEINIPPSATTFSIYGEVVANPGLGSALEQSSSDIIYREDESVLEDASEPTHLYKNMAAGISTMQSRFNASLGLSPEAWKRSQAISDDMEALFEHMLFDDFDIHKDPSEFILTLTQKVFGQAREIKTMEIVLAPPDPTTHTEYSPHGLFNCPGLVLWPSTLIPMDHTEIEIHASKHLRTLLSCKNLLSQHAIQIADDERVDEEFVSEALWEYENFLRHRFNPPPNIHGSSDVDEVSEMNSIHGPIPESGSSDSLQAIWELQSEFSQRFTWPPDRDPPSGLDSQVGSPVFSPAPPVSPVSAWPAGDDKYFGSLTTPAPPSNEVTHVRTFRVYEAIKIDNYTLTYDSY